MAEVVLTSSDAKQVIARDRARLLQALNDYYCEKCKEKYQVPVEVDRLRDIIVAINSDQSSHYLSYHIDGNVSYAPKPSWRLDVTHRLKTSLGRYIRSQLGFGQDLLSDKFIEQMSYEIMGRLAQPDVDGKLQLLTGEDIVVAYHKELGCHSCMTASASHFTELYALNPDRISLVNYDNRTRALLWLTDEGQHVLDRIYPNSGAHVTTLQGWALGLGYVYRMSTSGGTYGLSDNGIYHVTLTSTGKYCPYMDTFIYAMFDKEKQLLVLSNSMKEIEENPYTLTRTDGTLPWGIRWYCKVCEAELTDREVRFYYSPRNEKIAYCKEHFEESFACCGRCASAFPKSEIIHIDDINQNWCKGCASAYTYICSGCGKHARHHCVTADTNRHFCQECAKTQLHMCDWCGSLLEGKLATRLNGNKVCPPCKKNLAATDKWTAEEPKRKAKLAELSRPDKTFKDQLCEKMSNAPIGATFQFIGLNDRNIITVTRTAKDGWRSSDSHIYKPINCYGWADSVVEDALATMEYPEGADNAT